MQTTTIKAFFVALLALCLSPLASADSYSYDNLNRLTAVGYTSAGGQTYGYDPAGNLLSLVSTPAAGSTYTLTVRAINSTGSGTVTGSGINCTAATCTASVASGNVVTLTATPTAGSALSSIGGPGCSANPCTFTMPAASVSVNAIFVAGQTYSLTANASPTMGGTVSGMGTGAYAAGAVRGITATANAGYTFTSWSGYAGCTTANPCYVTMPAAAVNLTALFARVTSTLTVSASPAAGGTVSGAGSVAANTLATVSATANPGYTFTGWSGYGYAVCASLNPCSFNMPASAVNLLAVFSATTFPLTVSKLGNGSGSVSSSVAGINCGATCSANFTSGASVTLTAAAAAGSTFAGWNGACTGTGSCVVSMSAVQGVMATFALNAPGVSFNPPSITFADQIAGTTSAARTVTLTNTGNAALSIASVLPSIPVFAVTHNCGGSLPAGASCTLSITFSPAAAGTRLGSITLTSNAAGSPHSVTVSGNGLASLVPLCSLSAVPARIQPGRSATLTASCNPAATSYNWTGGTCAGTTSLATCMVTPAASTSYGVTGTNGNGAGVASAPLVLIVKAVDLTPILMLLLD